MMRHILRAALLLALLVTPSAAWLTDTGTHAPPAWGVYAYESWTPASIGFPAVGGEYLDPIFGETFLRITNISPQEAGSGIIYGRNGLWNADGTAYLHDIAGAVELIDPRTGALIRANVPYPYTTTDEVSFDPVNPDVYYYTSGTQLKSYSLSSNTSSTVNTFGAPLEGVGQSADWIDKTGRYFLLNVGGNLRVWDKQTSTLFTGSIPVPTGTDGIPLGWAGLAPNAAYVILSLNPDHWSYAVNTSTQTLSTTGVMFWDACFDHADIMTATDGNTYLLTANCLYGRDYYRVKVTNNATGQGAAQLTLPGNQQLLPIGASDTAGGGHFACAATGAMQDWCYASIEDPADQIGKPGAWYPYKQELVLIHMLSPFEVRRLAHHRSRPIRGFCRTPRVNTNWDGTALIFASPFSAPDTTGCGYSDLYRWDVP
jgi:hypothetical protein